MKTSVIITLFFSLSSPHMFVYINLPPSVPFLQSRIPKWYSYSKVPDGEETEGERDCGFKRGSQNIILCVTKKQDHVSAPLRYNVGALQDKSPEEKASLTSQ